MKKLLTCLSLVAIITTIGCGSTPKGTTYKTINALQTAVEVGLAEYSKWAALQERDHPENAAALLRLDGKVHNALEAYKTAATAALRTLDVNATPTSTLVELGNAFLAIATQHNLN